MTTSPQDLLAGRQLLALTQEELQRLVLDVHDGPVQFLFAALSQLTAVRARMDSDGVRGPYVAPIERAVECVEAALAEIRRTVTAFRAPTLTERGLAGAIEELVIGHEARTGSSVDFSVIDELPRVSVATTIVLYRVVQEALSNVERHSGVNEASVRLWVAPGKVCAHVVDRGRGFHPPDLVGPSATQLPEHIGLRGMRERASLVGGTVQVESRAGGGTRVYVEVPRDD